MAIQLSVPYSPEQASAMREVFRLLKSWGVSSARIAQQVGTQVRNIDNFISTVEQKNGEGRKHGPPVSRHRDPVYRIWCLYYNYAYNYLDRTDDPEMVHLLKTATGQYGNTALTALANTVIETSHADTQVVNTNYAGTYLTYSFTYTLNYINITCITIFYDSQCRAVRFEHRYRTRQEILRTAIGYLVPTERTLNFIGSIDGTSHLSMAIIRRQAAPERHFLFLHGILLSVDRDANQFASKIVMKRLPKGATIEQYDHEIRLTCVSEERRNDESEQEFEKRQAFVREIRAVKGLCTFINNATPNGGSLKLLAR